MVGAASPRAICALYSIPAYKLRAAIGAGELVPRAMGCRSLLLFSAVERWLESQPPTKSRKRKSENIGGRHARATLS